MYLDPGAGSLLIAIATGFIASLPIIIRTYWERIKSAIRLPEQKSPLTPVNTYRIILNELIEAGMEMLPDKLYFPLVFIGEEEGNPATNFVDMTSVVKE